MLESGSSRLIEGLVADTHRRRALWPPAWRMVAWFGAALVLFGLVAGAGLRGDLLERLHESRFLLEVTTAGLLAMLLAHRTFLTAIPGRQHAPAATAVALVCAAVVASLAPLHPVDVTQSLDTFLDRGLACLRDTTLLALVPAGILLVAARRGAPLLPAQAGALAGAAGWVTAYLLMRFRCPLEDALHLCTWHLLPGFAGAALAAGVGLVWLGRWKYRAGRST
jgi:hypothetical protein